MAAQIDRDVPLPANNRSTWPWADMEVGDSFGAPINKHNALRAGVAFAGKKLGRKFICRLHGDGVRVWRTA